MDYIGKVGDKPMSWVQILAIAARPNKSRSFCRLVNLVHNSMRKTRKSSLILFKKIQRQLGLVQGALDNIASITPMFGVDALVNERLVLAQDDLIRELLVEVVAVVRHLESSRATCYGRIDRLKKILKKQAGRLKR